MSIVEPIPNDVPPLDAQRRRGVLEVDAFCPGCQYNLHGQPVAVDERLQIPVCRCPECGRFHPAGVGVSASGLWTRRLAALLLTGWVLLVVAMTVTSCFFLGLLSLGTIGYYEYSVPVASDGRELEAVTGKNGGFNNAFVYLGTQTPAKYSTYTSRVRPIFERLGPDVVQLPPWESGRDRAVGPVPALWMSAGSLALGGLVGAGCVTFCWHWSRRRYVWAMAVPGLAAAVLLAIIKTNDQFVLIRGEASGRVLAQTGIQCAGVLVGIVLGRPVARGVLRAVVPPKPRQSLAFLWQADGKPMPA